MAQWRGIKVALFTTKADPCCITCPEGEPKYYSIDQGGDCGEACISDSMYPILKMFEPGLLKVQGWAKKWAPGLVELVPAVAYQLCSICLQHSRNHVPSTWRNEYTEHKCILTEFNSIL